MFAGVSPAAHQPVPVAGLSAQRLLVVDAGVPVLTVVIVLALVNLLLHWRGRGLPRVQGVLQKLGGRRPVDLRIKVQNSINMFSFKRALKSPPHLRARRRIPCG